MSQVEPIEMRLEMKAASNGCTILNDSYNSDLQSLEIAIEAAYNQTRAQSLSIILSDLLQTGIEPNVLYQVVAQLITKKGFKQVIGVGKEVSLLQNHLPKAMNQAYFKETDDLLVEIDKSIRFKDALILVKGARQFAFERIVHRLQQKNHHAVLEVNLVAMTHNLNVYRRALKQSVKMMVMVKAAGYGSGEGEAAKLLEHHGVDYLGVAYADEGIGLRVAGIQTPIMVLNPAPDEFDAMFRFDLEPEIYSLEILDAICAYTGQHKAMKIHLKLDTGMHRLGFEPKHIASLIERLKAFNNLRIASVFTHLAASDKSKFDSFTHGQVEAFLAMYDTIVGAISYRPDRHVANSGAIPRFPEYQFEMVRLGIGLYGAEGAGLKEPLQVVHTLKARISQIKEVEAGQTVGYNRNGPILKLSRIATVNIGYADGLLRAAGNGNYQFSVLGQKARTVGNICMDMCMIDITDIAEAQVGDEVIVFGAEPRVEELATALGTISYEVFTNVSNRVKRVYFLE